MPDKNKKPSGSIIETDLSYLREYEKRASWTAEKLHKNRFFDALFGLSENKTNRAAIALAIEYDTKGDSKNALAELKKVDTSVYASAPFGAHNYYAALLMAYIISGDLDHVADTFNKGFYYMNTYKDSPADGAFVSRVLGMYEDFCGHCGAGLQLLDDMAEDQKK